MIFRRKRYSPIGLDVGPRAIRAVQLVHDRDGSKACAAANFPRINPGETLNPAEILRAVGVLRRQGFVGDQTVICLPSDKMLSAVVELPTRTSGAPLDAIARQELARSCKKDPGSIEIAWWELPTPASAAPGSRSAQGTQALALGCSHADADALLACFDPSGLDVVAIDALPAAIARACASFAADAPNLTAVLALGFEAAHILILVGSTLVYERTLPEASMRLLCSGLANQLSISEPIAEHVLLTIGCVSPDANNQGPASEEPHDEMRALGAEARALVCAHADALAGELKTSLSYAARRFEGAVMRILLSGVGAEIPGIGPRIAQRAGIPEGEARIARADMLAPACPDVDPAPLGPSAALALGLALHGAPNFAPHAEPRGAATTERAA